MKKRDRRQSRLPFWDAQQERYEPPTKEAVAEARALALSVLGPPPQRYDRLGRKILESDQYGPVVVAKRT